MPSLEVDFSVLCEGAFFNALVYNVRLKAILIMVSWQHVDIAALLIKYKGNVNATDRWLFTPLHEAAQKGRTQLCALLVSRYMSRHIIFFQFFRF